MPRKLLRTRRIGGTLRVPGDKSIAHRSALLSILAEEPVVIDNFPGGADCHRSLEAAKAFGVTVEESAGQLVLHPPRERAHDTDLVVDCGNSGTTARLLAGIAAGSQGRVTLTGDESLSRRPMGRVVEPLRAMGAELYDDNGHLPLRVVGRKLLPFEYRMKVASAQVKSSLLLAGLASGCSVTIREDIMTRDHTELMIAAIGTGIAVREIKPVPEPDPVDPRKRRLVMPEPFRSEIILNSNARIRGGAVSIPGDMSTAAFFFAAAAISGGTVTVTELGLNRTRSAFLDHLKGIGCTVSVAGKECITGEWRGTVSVTGGTLRSCKIGGETTVGLIDEIPIVAVMAAFADGTTLIRDAQELKVKESDRLLAIAENLRAMGVKCGLLEDGLAIEGRKGLQGADLRAFGDHRIAMAFSVASLMASGPCTLDNDAVVGVSCPEFYELLGQIVS